MGTHEGGMLSPGEGKAGAAAETNKPAGKPEVTDLVPVEGDARALLSLAAQVEKPSEHPLAAAVLGRAQADGLKVFPADRFDDGIRRVFARAGVVEQVLSPRIGEEFGVCAESDC